MQVFARRSRLIQYRRSRSRRMAACEIATRKRAVSPIFNSAKIVAPSAILYTRHLERISTFQAIATVKQTRQNQRRESGKIREIADSVTVARYHEKWAASRVSDCNDHRIWWRIRFNNTGPCTVNLTIIKIMAREKKLKTCVKLAPQH